jgi:hypothetical protein
MAEKKIKKLVALPLEDVFAFVETKNEDET